jgi:ribosome maturation factor RimP
MAFMKFRFHVKWGRPTFFYGKIPMTHPVIPQVLALAATVAEPLGLAVVQAVFRTNQSPPVLRLDIRNVSQDTGLEDCERMSRAFEPILDESGLLADATYVLEISSPGVPQDLESDRDFISFRGFPVLVATSAAIKDQSEWQGNLLGRDETSVMISLKGRTVKIPRDQITTVQLVEGTAE